MDASNAALVPSSGPETINEKLLRFFMHLVGNQFPTSFNNDPGLLEGPISEAQGVLNDAGAVEALGQIEPLLRRLQALERGELTFPALTGNLPDTVFTWAVRWHGALLVDDLDAAETALLALEALAPNSGIVLAHRATFEMMRKRQEHATQAMRRLIGQSMPPATVAGVRSMVLKNEYRLRENQENIEEQSSKHYGEALEHTWTSYLNQFSRMSSLAAGLDLQKAGVSLVRKVVTLDNNFKSIINFGSFCGVLEHHVAQHNPKINVIGVDRLYRAIDLNKIHFAAPNLKYVCGTLDDAVAEIGDRHVFAVLHIRTTSEMMPSVLDDFYADCARLGAKYILGVELFGPSLFSGAYPDPTRLGWASNAVTGQVGNHDYVGKLQQHGYDLGHDEFRPFARFLPGTYENHFGDFLNAIMYRSFIGVRAQPPG